MPASETPASATQAAAASVSPFLERLILVLMPYFAAITQDLDTAREEILETLASYGARTRAEMINAVRIIAFSFSTLDTLAEAEAPDMPASMRLRYRSCANTLNRSCQQNEQALAKRLACEPPAAMEPPGDPVNDLTDQETEAAIRNAQSEIALRRNRLSAPQSPGRPANTQTPEDENKRLWGRAMVNILHEMGMPVQPVAAP